VIKHDEAEIKVSGEDLHEIWWQGRQWAVTAYGIECRVVVQFERHAINGS
jgi:hypothetical protein